MSKVSLLSILKSSSKLRIKAFRHRSLKGYKVPLSTVRSIMSGVRLLLVHFMTPLLMSVNSTLKTCFLLVILAKTCFYVSYWCLFLSKITR
jgi:hypothetical protein